MKELFLFVMRLRHQSDRKSWNVLRWDVQLPVVCLSYLEAHSPSVLLLRTSDWKPPFLFFSPTRMQDQSNFLACVALKENFYSTAIDPGPYLKHIYGRSLTSQFFIDFVFSEILATYWVSPAPAVDSETPRIWIRLCIRIRFWMVSEGVPRPSKIWFWCINWFRFMAFFLHTSSPIPPPRPQSKTENPGSAIDLYSGSQSDVAGHDWMQAPRERK